MSLYEFICHFVFVAIPGFTVLACDKFQEV